MEDVIRPGGNGGEDGPLMVFLVVEVAHPNQVAEFGVGFLAFVIVRTASPRHQNGKSD